MTEIKILKAKIVKKQTLSVEYSRQEKDKSVTIISEEHRADIHQDLRDAFVGLHIHFAILSDYVKTKQVKDIRAYDSELIEGFSVSTLHQGGAEDESYIILTGSKITASGRAVTINTPILKIEEQEKGYKYIDELLERVEHIEKEVKAYLSGKVAPESQQSLSFPDAPDKPKRGNKAQVLPPEGPIESVVKDIVEKTNGKPEKADKPAKPGPKKRVAQTAANKSGIVED